ncbi:hypothetical protein [Sphingomonas koreensis]|uniref:hypothetical protein n=1 Tax=Sphingomonas koreensis TaxID=93064 RepID=UPI00234F067B|nr:hypothetical protein [Sphingomonas koreensis]MDC7811583.1 hypothetical protein [Sphingomonas koreensis]
MELAVAGEDTDGVLAARGDDAQQQIVGVAGEDDGRRVGQTQLGGDLSLRSGIDLAHHPAPFMVGEACGVFPRRLMADP